VRLDADPVVAAVYGDATVESACGAMAMEPVAGTFMGEHDARGPRSVRFDADPVVAAV
jgi:hypothetical protein